MGRRRLLIHSNAGGDFGMGHLMRCLALVEESLSRGWVVRWCGGLDGRARELLGRLAPAVAIEPCAMADAPGSLHDLANAWHPDVLHLDTYLLPSVGVPRGVHLCSSMQDGDHGQIISDLAIDANLGAEGRLARPALCGAYLLGADAIAVRRQVLAQRPPRERVAGPPRVLVVLGGTDPFGLTSAVVGALDTVAAPLSVTVVTPTGQRAAIETIASLGSHHFNLVDFVTDLPAMAKAHDLVISAAGTSVWDFACMGVPMALLGVVDNQRDGYLAAVESGFALGLGVYPDLDVNDLPNAMNSVESLLFDEARLRAMSELGMKAVDGLGAWRIVGAWEQMLDARPGRSADSVELRARPAALADAELLHQWRNQEATRLASRSSDEIPWGLHLSWLTNSLERDDRQLLVVEDNDVPVGTVRWDRLAGRDWEVSVTVAPECRGRGMAVPVLRAGERGLSAEGTVRLLATVHEDNIASRRAFAALGYLPYRPADANGFLTAMRWRVPPDAG